MPGAPQKLLNSLEWEHGENSVLGKLAPLYIRHFWLGGWGHRGRGTDYRRNQNLSWRSTGILWKWKRNVFAVKYTEHKFYHIFNHFSVHNAVASSTFMLFYHHHQRRNFIAICRWCAISAHDLCFICFVIWTFPSNLSHIAKYQYYNDLEIKQKKRN